jgi:GntR family transcriptional regulator/MocR family aminotransferase
VPVDEALQLAGPAARAKRLMLQGAIAGPRRRAGRAAVTKSKFPLDILVLDRSSAEPLHRQLYSALRQAILDGALRSSFSLPPTRTLARQLTVGRNTVIAAYEQLIAEGHFEARSGKGTWVATLPDLAPSRPALVSPLQPKLSCRGTNMAEAPRYWTTPGKLAFHPGYPEIRTFPLQAWSRLLADAGCRLDQDLFGYHFIGGLPALREAIAAYLGASRGVVCRPEQVIVVTGAQAALDLAARIFVDEGDVVWMEEPGYAGARNAFQNAGAALRPLPVGADGWRLGDMGGPKPRLIYVTPSCQMPRGMVMRMDERLALLTIAERAGAWIIEDDYDSEYRFRGRPVPAMQGLDRAGCVLYIGTFGKVLFPSLRIGFLVVPAALAASVAAVVSSTGQAVPLQLQFALARFIREGAFARHLKRTRRLYARRQKLFIGLCDLYVGRWLTLQESEAGMQLVGRLRQDFDDRAVASLAFARGLDVEPLSASFCGPVEHGLRLGFAGFDRAETVAGLEILRAVFLMLENEPGVFGSPSNPPDGSFGGTKSPVSSSRD